MMRRTARTVVLTSLLLGGCRPDAPVREPSRAAPDLLGPPAQVDTSAAGMVVTASPLATLAGVAMLEAGGNAADAAAAAAFALAVVEPSMSGLGGRQQVLLRNADGELRAIDATTQAPRGYDSGRHPPASHGYATIGIPGMVAGTIQLHDEHGSLSRAQVMAPALNYARNGFVLSAGEAGRIAGTRERLLESEGAREYFLKADASAYAGGDVLVQEDLARTLEAIVEGGAAAFYEGRIAERIVDDMEANGGFLTLEDLAGYRAVQSKVVRGEYRGYELVGSGVPAAGGTVIEILQIMESFPLAEVDEGDWLSIVGQAIRLGLLDYYGPIPVEEEWADLITSKEWAAQRSREIRVPGRAGDPRGSAPGATSAAPLHYLDSHEHTSHLTVADSEGMVVALTQSLGPAMGSKVAAPDLGFTYATTLGGYLGPMTSGQRGASAISPFLILEDGQPRYGLGAAGGLRIVSAIVEVTSRLIDRGLSLPEAVGAARFYPGVARGTEPGPWDVEDGPVASFTPSERARAEEMGFVTEPQARPTAFGRIHAVAFEIGTGKMIGVADPRWEGSAGAPSPR